MLAFYCEERKLGDMTETIDFRVEERRRALQEIAVGSTVLAMGSMQACFEVFTQAIAHIPAGVYSHSEYSLGSLGDYKGLLVSAAIAGIGYYKQQRGLNHLDWVEGQY